MTESYIPKNPELSNIKAYQRLRLKKLYDLALGIGMISFGLYLLVQLKPFLRANTVYSFSSELVYPCLYFAFLFSVIILLVIYFKKHSIGNIRYLFLLIVLCPFLYYLQDKSLTIYQLYTPDLLVNLTFISIFAVFIISSALIFIGALVVLDLYFIFISGISGVINFFEYRSEKTHTGIIIPYNSGRILDISYFHGLYLAKKFFKNETEPFRVYFCSKRQEVIDVIHNKNVINLWIFGHGTRGSVDLTDRSLFYVDLKDLNIAKKGYIHQYHCNCEVNESDKYSLCDLLIPNEKRELSTDTGKSGRLKFLIEDNYRDITSNEKGINEYIQKKKDLQNNKK